MGDKQRGGKYSDAEVANIMRYCRYVIEKQKEMKGQNWVRKKEVKTT